MHLPQLRRLRIQMKAKKKKCDGPCGEFQFIWKNHEGKRYCKSCWSALSVRPRIKPTSVQKRVPSRSPKRAKEEQEYSIRRKEFLSKNCMCQAHIPGVCRGQATDVHHKAGRVGDLLLNILYWLAACRACHEWIEMHPKEAKEMGFSLTRLDK